MTTKNCVNGPKLVRKDLCEKSFVRNDQLPLCVITLSCNKLWGKLFESYYKLVLGNSTTEGTVFYFCSWQGTC